MAVSSRTAGSERVLQNNCIVIGNYARRRLYSANNCCTIIDKNVNESTTVCSLRSLALNYILEVGSARITIAPGEVSLFWPNESCTKRCIHSSNPEDRGYIDTMAKT